LLGASPLPRRAPASTTTTTGRAAIMDEIPVKDVKRGEYVKRSKKAGAQVYIKGGFCRSTQKYNLTPVDDVFGNGIMVNGSTHVFVGFDY
jgi:hypothetical protein